MLIIAGMAHLTSVLLLPQVAPRDAFLRLADAAPVNRLVALPQPAPGQELTPYNDPQTALGVCRYDLRGAPLRLQAQAAGDTFISFSFHDRRGVVFYSMTDRAAVRARIDVVLGIAAQIEALEASDSGEELAQDLRLTAPSPEGYVLVRALAERPGAMARARAQIQSFACAPENG